MVMYRTVVVPLDGSAGASAALAPAGQVARRFGADLMPVHAPGVVEAVRAFDEPLLCVGADTRAHLGRAVLGPVATRVLSELDGPFLLIGPHCARVDWAVDAYLFACVDGTTISEAVLPVATAWAGDLGLTACLLHAVAPRPATTPAAPGLPQRDVLESNYVAGLAHGLRRAGIRVDWEVAHGRAPAKAIVSHAASRGAALVAVGSHSRPGSKGPLGRVAREVVATSPVPVLVTRSQGLWRAVMALAEQPAAKLLQ
jgi:nucleotide-binding universal stress UspA family protein